MEDSKYKMFLSDNSKILKVLSNLNSIYQHFGFSKFRASKGSVQSNCM